MKHGFVARRERSSLALKKGFSNEKITDNNIFLQYCI